MTWVRDAERGRGFRLESVVGWQWRPATAPAAARVLEVWLPGHALTFDEGAGADIELQLLAAGGPTLDVIATPPEVDVGGLANIIGSVDEWEGATPPDEANHIRAGLWHVCQDSTMRHYPAAACGVCTPPRVR